MLMTCLTEMHMKDSGCNALIEETAAALNDDVVSLMLIAVQKGNIELSVKISDGKVRFSSVQRLFCPNSEP